MGWAGCGCEKCREYESVKLANELRGPSQIADVTKRLLARDVRYDETHPFRYRPGIGRPYEPQPDEWVGAA